MNIKTLVEQNKNLCQNLIWDIDMMIICIGIKIETATENR